MSHPSAEELHQVAYGLAPPPAHLDGCLQCREDLAAIEAERTALRDVLREDLDAPLRRKHGGRALQISAVAALLLGLVVLLVWVPGRTPVPAKEDDVEQLLNRVEQLTTEATKLELEIAQLEMVIQHTRNMLDPDWIKKQKSSSPRPLSEEKK